MTSHDLAPGSRQPWSAFGGIGAGLLGRRTREAVLVGLPALIVMALGWRRRWVGDDGMIYTRTVRQILAGHGPVFNLGERAEASTGTLWQWLVAAAAYTTGRDPSLVAVALGVLLTGVGYALAVAAARKAVRPLTAAPLLPLGMLVLLAVKADWDYATSGLENGLSTGWIGLAWWRLVGARGPETATAATGGRPPGAGGTAARDRSGYGTAFVLGLGPLVRPDLALVSAVFLVALRWMLRPGPARLLALFGTAAALPAGYEVFRAGYYGVLAPLPALAKEASDAVWARGLEYFSNFVDPYRLWLPLMLLAALAAWVPRRALRPELLAPPVAGLLSWLYVCRVGGDFMHGRLLLPGLLLLMLPLCAAPLTRPTGTVAGALVVWGVLCALLCRPAGSSGSPYLILDEQANYTAYTGDPHPVSEAAHARRPKPLRPAIRAAEAAGRPVLLLPTGPGDGRFASLPLSPRLQRSGARLAGAYDLLGYNGIVTPLDGVSVDPLGLAYPLVAHQARAPARTGGRSGHEKLIDPAWIVADYTDPGTRLPAGLDPARVRAARHALTCGSLAELQSSVRAPLTPGRFWRNLLGAWSRTSFRYPAEPVRAERALCGG